MIYLFPVFLFYIEILVHLSKYEENKLYHGKYFNMLDSYTFIYTYALFNLKLYGLPAFTRENFLPWVFFTGETCLVTIKNGTGGLLQPIFFNDVTYMCIECAHI